MASLIRELLGRIRGDVPIRLLRQRGLTAGANLHVGPGCVIDPMNCHLISMGTDVTLAPGVYVLAHDASTKRHLGYSRIGMVTIGNRVFIGARAVILPGVSIGDHSIIGAGSVVTRDVPAGTIAAGNPARPVGETEEYLEEHRTRMASGHVWDASRHPHGALPSPAVQHEQLLALRSGERCYID